MSEPIKVGDLVMIVRGHECFVAEVGGRVFFVEAIVPQRNGGWYCPRCKTGNHAQSDLFGARAGWKKDPDAGIPLSYLKRIDPPAELDGEKRKEELYV